MANIWFTPEVCMLDDQFWVARCGIKCLLGSSVLNRSAVDGANRIGVFPISDVESWLKPVLPMENVGALNIFIGAEIIDPHIVANSITASSADKSTNSLFINTLTSTIK